MAFDIFIAHAGADTSVAEEMYDALIDLGVSCFLDTKCLQLGDDWNVRLPQAQRESQATVVLVSRNCDRAFYQKEEIAAAIEMARTSAPAHRVIPLYITEPHVSDIPYGLRTKHGLYLTRESTVRSAAQRLAEPFIPRTPPILIPARTLTYDIDLCICLDLSSSLRWLVTLMKQQLLTLGFDIANAMSEKGKSIGRLRVSVITFGPPDVPIERTPMIELPAGAATLYERALSLKLAGGGPPESACLEALNEAMNSDWSPGRGRRHIVTIWTDRDCTSSIDLNVLEERWIEMDSDAKRLLMFAPPTPTWESVAGNWDQTIWFPVGEGGGLTELERTEILDAIANSV